MICVLQEIRKRKIEKVCPFQFDQFSKWHSISSSKRIRWNYQMCVRVCVCVRERERNSRVGFPFDFLWTQTQKSVCGGRNQRWPLQPTESVFFSSFGQTAGSPSYSYLTNCGNRFEPFLDGPEIFFFQIERNTKISTTVKRRHIHKVTYSTRLTTHIYIKQILSYF